MRRALIHIGSGKAGSSSIQFALTNMQEHGICYPMIEGTGHQNIEVLFRSREKTSRGIRSRFSNDANDAKEYKQYARNYKQRLKNIVSSTKDDIILSSEFLFWLKREEISALRDFLKDWGIDRFVIFVYLREPSSYYLSFVQQEFKASSTFTSPREFKCGYKKYIENWMKVFGDDSVRVSEFSRDTLEHGDVVKDFEQFINKYFRKKINLVSTNKNISMSAEAMVIMQQHRMQYMKNLDGIVDSYSNKLFKELRNIKMGTRPKLKPWVIDTINQNSVEDIEYIKHTFGLFKNLDYRIQSDSVIPQKANTSVECILEKVDTKELNKIYEKLKNLNQWFTYIINNPCLEDT